MKQEVLAIVIAIVGAFFLAVGTWRQSLAVKKDTGGSDLGVKGFFSLIKNPTWLAGWLLMVLGIACNFVALSLAPLTIIQPLGAVALVITTVLNAHAEKTKLNRQSILAIVMCVGGSAAFVILAIQVTQDNPNVSDRQEHLLVIIMTSVTVFFGILALFFRKKLSPFVYILGAGVLFGFVAVLTRVIALDVIKNWPHIFTNFPWIEIIGLICTTVLGLWFVQSAYSKGPPELVVAGLTVIDPIVGISVGIMLLGELKPHPNVIITSLMLIAAVVAVVGVVILSRFHPEVIKRKNTAVSEVPE